MAVVHLLLLAAFNFQYIKRYSEVLQGNADHFQECPEELQQQGTGWALWVVSIRFTFESRALLAVCALCLGHGEAKTAWAVLLCSELTGAGDGATSCEASFFTPQFSLTYDMSQEEKLELQTTLHGGKILPVSFSGKGLVKPKDTQMISCTLLSNSSHRSLPKFLFQSPRWTWCVPEAVLVGMCFIRGMKFYPRNEWWWLPHHKWLWVIGNPQTPCEVL